MVNKKCKEKENKVKNKCAMKKVLFLIVLITIIHTGFGQSELGQTKGFAISQNKTCHIDLNDERIIVFSCNEGERIKFYGFDKNSLCFIIGFELSNSMRNEFKSMLTETGCKFLGTDSFPILLVLKSGQNNTYSQAEVYANEEYIFKILEFDLCGNDNTDKFGIYVERFKDVPGIESAPSYVSGSGFAISSDGVIATNYHVIEGAKTINVKGINGDYENSVTAKILITDKINDLALIKVDDHFCINLGEIPYSIKNQNSKVGENIFVLGYPLRLTMGNEIKLTNGIISSNKGFQDDISSFQISAPIQPGNSGCPLFNSKGDLIGIINAKHIGAENASYAIKSNYLVSLINSLDEPPMVKTQSTVIGKSLASQVEIIKKFVYIIGCE